MLSDSMASSPKLGVTGRYRFGPGRGVNIFRDAWQYRITDAGVERLAARSGASPAFMTVLGIAQAGPVSFASIARQMPNIDGDDLELWLSAMCTMGLLATVESEATLAEIAGLDSAEAAEAAAKAAAPEVAKPSPEPAPSAPAPAGLALLVHADHKTRANWRRALSGRGFDFLEAADLETVEAHVRERRPAWVVLGLKGEDFEGLHLLRALKRPRAPRISRVCLVVPRGSVLDQEEQDTAARADATAASVPDIVRALCGEDALDAPTKSPDSAAASAAGAEIAEVPALPVVAPEPRPAPQRPENAPVWMNLIYGDAYRFGSFETASPSALESQYPRLLVRMIESWSRPEFEREINGLILDDRGDRHGFPPEVMGTCQPASR
jgi:ActR/RegA family two-component response regulator